MPFDSLPVEFLFRMEAMLTKPITISPGPQGDRLIIGVKSGSFEGPKLRGQLVGGGPGSEWANNRPDGSQRVDVRLVLETDDGEFIGMTYNGVAVPEDDTLKVTTAPTFQTGAAKYAWLNNVQAVGIGDLIPKGIAYDVYRVLWPR